MKKLALLIAILMPLLVNAQDYEIVDTIYEGQENETHIISLVRVYTDTLTYEVKQDYLDNELLDVLYDIWSINQQLSFINDRLSVETNETYINKLQQEKIILQGIKKIKQEKRTELQAIQALIDSQ